MNWDLLIALSLAFSVVIALNYFTLTHANNLWKATTHLRKPYRRYTLAEMRALLEDERARKIAEGQ